MCLLYLSPSSSRNSSYEDRLFNLCASSMILAGLLSTILKSIKNVCSLIYNENVALEILWRACCKSITALNQSNIFYYIFSLTVLTLNATITLEPPTPIASPYFEQRTSRDADWSLVRELHFNLEIYSEPISPQQLDFLNNTTFDHDHSCVPYYTLR